MKLDIFGHMVKLRLVDDVMEAFGKTDSDHIWIVKNLKDQVKFESLIHEIYHVVFPEKCHHELDTEAKIVTEVLYRNNMLKWPEEE